LRFKCFDSTFLPVDEDRDGDGRRPRPVSEHFSGDQPWDRSGSEREEDDEGQRGNDQKHADAVRAEAAVGLASVLVDVLSDRDQNGANYHSGDSDLISQTNIIVTLKL